MSNVIVISIPIAIMFISYIAHVFGNWNVSRVLRDPATCSDMQISAALMKTASNVESWLELVNEHDLAVAIESGVYKRRIRPLVDTGTIAISRGLINRQDLLDALEDVKSSRKDV